jgi:hypothetical protein
LSQPLPPPPLPPPQPHHLHADAAAAAAAAAAANHAAAVHAALAGLGLLPTSPTGAAVVSTVDHTHHPLPMAAQPAQQAQAPGGGKRWAGGPTSPGVAAGVHG